MFKPAAIVELYSHPGGATIVDPEYDRGIFSEFYNEGVAVEINGEALVNLAEHLGIEIPGWRWGDDVVSGKTKTIKLYNETPKLLEIQRTVVLCKDIQVDVISPQILEIWLKFGQSLSPGLQWEERITYCGKFSILWPSP